MGIAPKGPARHQGYSREESTDGSQGGVCHLARDTSLSHCTEDTGPRKRSTQYEGTRAGAQAYMF